MKEELVLLTDNDLITRLESLCEKEITVTIKVLLTLNEVEKRSLHLERGYGSLFSFCTKELRYSETAALRRITAARCIRDYPEVLELLLKREVNLTTVSLFSKLLTLETKDEVLEKVRGKSKAQVEKIVQSYRPREKTVEKITAVFLERKVTAPRGGESRELFQGELPKQELSLSESSKSEPISTAPSGGDLRLEERYELRFSFGKDYMEKVSRVQLLLSRSIRGKVSLEVLFQNLIDSYLLKKSILSEGRKTRSTRTSGSRYIAESVKREVFKRDNYECSYVGTEGTRCGSQHGLEIDHVKPYALGGDNTVENLRVVCGNHNRHMAKKGFGEGKFKRI